MSIKPNHDALNRRIVKTTYTKATDTTISHRYLYHNDNIIAILDNTKEEPTLLASIVHHPSRTDTPLSITNHTTNQTYYYHRAPQGHFRRLCSGHNQGSIIALTNEQGNIVEHITYDGHYGKILKHTKEEETLNPYGYTGRETDQSDLYYYRARYYDPYTQRFLSTDPIEFEAGDFNFYRYVGNDPVNFRDPSGLFICGGICLGAIAVGIAGSIGAHYGRNIFNDDVSYDKVQESPWILLEDDKSIYHQMGDVCNLDNEKYVHPNGSEAVFSSAGKPITDELNMATYNYFNPDTFFGIPHGITDVAPYFIMGNTPSDMFTTDRFTTTWDRVIKPKLGIK